jgi:hypothetical protein
MPNDHLCSGVQRFVGISYVYFLVRRPWRLFNFAIWNPQYSWVLGVPLLMGISYVHF